MKTILTLLWLLIAGLAEARSYDDVIASGYIEIAVYRDFPPYSYLKNGRPSGIDIEMGKLIADGLGVEARWFWITADESLEDDLRNAVWKGHVLEKKVADLMLRVPYDREFSYAIDGYGQAKNSLVVMFAPYHRESWTLVRDLKKTGQIRNLAIFQYERVGVELDSLPDFFLSATLNGRLRNQIVHFPTVFDGIEAMRRGEVSAVAGMLSQIEWGLTERSPQYEVADDGLGSMSKVAWDIGMAVKHDYRQLSYAVEAVIEERLRQGQVQKIFARHRLSYQLPSVYR